jgi:hypothetical protein
VRRDKTPTHNHGKKPFEKGVQHPILGNTLYQKTQSDQIKARLPNPFQKKKVNKKPDYQKMPIRQNQ